MFHAKYIMLEEHIPIIFPPSIEHKSVADKFANEKVTSAGFLFVANNEYGRPEVYTFGESISLDLEPKDTDSYWLTELLFE